MFDHLLLHCILFLSENILNQSSILQFLFTSEFRLISLPLHPFSLPLFFLIEVIAVPSQDNDSKNSNFLDIKDDLDMLEKRTYNLLQVIEHLHFFPFHFISFQFTLLFFVLNFTVFQDLSRFSYHFNFNFYSLFYYFKL